MASEVDFVFDEQDDHAFRHVNPDGSMGGWVSRFATVSPEAFVDFTSVVGPWGVVPAGSRIGCFSYIGMASP